MVSRFSRGRRNSTLSSSRTRLSKKACIWCCEAGSERSGIANGKVAAGRKLEPFVADQQHRLRQVQRGKTRIDRKGDDPVGERDLLVLQAVALPAEQDADPAAGPDMGHDLGGRFHRRDHRLGLVVGAGGGGEQQRQVGDRLLDGIEQLGLLQNLVGAGRRPLCRDVRPAVARIDDSQTRQRKIAHRARGHADILAKLRLDEDHNWSG